eukprot:TRINITY_DN43918_c0_g1_i1.p1 TRINITY_DN43918_c0_g1~~TRINITY_DN43918_c0_g1_i1.p1  ORF type:complete len:764 (-),score=137.21 TRINITY_DN43918_c0_g1_i1:266-2557(-)
METQRRLALGQQAYVPSDMSPELLNSSDEAASTMPSKALVRLVTAIVAVVGFSACIAAYSARGDYAGLRASVAPGDLASAASSMCPNQSSANDFGVGSSAERMEHAGWRWSWTDAATRFRPPNLFQIGGVAVPLSSYYGWAAGADGTLSLKLLGRGTATVDFGNAGNSGNVSLLVDGQRKATAQPLQVNNPVTFPFHDSFLEIHEVNEGIIVVNRIIFNCPGAVLAAGSPAPVAAPVEASLAAPATVTPSASTAVAAPPAKIAAVPASSPLTVGGNVPGCGVPCVELTNFFGKRASLDDMLRSGWRFDWKDHLDLRFRPPTITMKGGVAVPDSSYYGWDPSFDAVLSLSLHHIGYATVSFGNAMSRGYVEVLLDSVVKGRADALHLTVVVGMPFHDGSLLEFKERNDGAIVVNSVAFDCTSTTMTTATTSTTVTTTSTTSLTDLIQHEVVSYVEVPLGVSGPICGTLSEEALNEFGNANSLEDMILAGWMFKWSDLSLRFRPASLFDVGGVAVPLTSYYGWDYPGDGVLSLSLLGAGSATVNFGNARNSGIVTVVVDDSLQSQAMPRELMNVVTFAFHEGSLIEIQEQNGAIIVLNSVKFDCTASKTTTTVTVCGATDATAVRNFGAGSSAEVMQAAGWSFNWRDPIFRFRPTSLNAVTTASVPPTSYYGLNSQGDGTLSRLLHGSGVVHINFGNAGDGGSVVVSFDGSVWMTAMPKSLSQVGSFVFHDQTVLEIQEREAAIIVLHDISFDCAIAPHVGEISH